MTRCARKAYLRPDQLVEVWSNVEANPVYGSRQSNPTEEQDKQHEVGISGGEIHHLGERDERQQRPFRAEINGDLCSVKAKKSNLSSTKLQRGEKRCVKMELVLNEHKSVAETRIATVHKVKNVSTARIIIYIPQLLFTRKSCQRMWPEVL